VPAASNALEPGTLGIAKRRIHFEKAQHPPRGARPVPWVLQQERQLWLHDHATKVVIFAIACRPRRPSFSSAVCSVLIDGADINPVVRWMQFSTTTNTRKESGPENANAQHGTSPQNGRWRHRSPIRLPIVSAPCWRGGIDRPFQAGRDRSENARSKRAAVVPACTSHRPHRAHHADT
jgi:hypothetical protein